MPAIVTQLSIDKLMLSDRPTVARSSADQRQIFSIGQQIMSQAMLGRYARDCHPTVDRQVDAFRLADGRSIIGRSATDLQYQATNHE